MGRETAPAVGVLRFSRRQFLLGSLAWTAWSSEPGVVQFGPFSFEALGAGRSNRRYLLIHGNEETAREVLRERMRGHQGLAHLIVGRTRHVSVGEGEIDPNRMFSREGARRNLLRLNPGWTAGQVEAALDELDSIRPALLEAILPRPGGLLVAVHNNLEGYSVRDEVPISDAVSLNEKGSPHEFFLATDPRDYQVLARSPYNAVLQYKAPSDDDGSLSRLAARRRLRYVNIEAALGEKRKQRRMLSWLEQHLPEQRPVGP
jgi:hypothetical protein